MLRVRLLSAIVLLPLVLACFIAGPTWLIIATLLLSLALCVHEMAGMLIPAFDRRLCASAAGASPADSPKGRRLAIVAVVLAAVMFLGQVWSDAGAAAGVICLVAFATLLIGGALGRSLDQAAARAYSLLISVCYAGLPWLVVWRLYEMGSHARFVLLVMAVTWMGDTGGYFGGRFIGGKVFAGRKLAPLISPKKTWEGALTGLALSVVGAFGLDYVFGEVAGLGPIARSGTLLACGILGGICGQLGDLIESLFKRFAGVKDSGAIIPGHGGFLDRVDGILFATPVIWAILYYFEPVRV